MTHPHRHAALLTALALTATAGASLALARGAVVLSAGVTLVTPAPAARTIVPHAIVAAGTGSAAAPGPRTAAGVSGPVGSTTALTAAHSGLAHVDDLTATLESVRQTATAVRLATSGTVTAQVATWTAEAVATRAVTATPTISPTATTTLPAPFATVDPCVCLTPPPGPTECADIIATLHAGYRRAFETQTALSRGTDTPTPPPTDTPTASPTATATGTATPAPTATRVPTTEPTPTTAATARPSGVALLPMLIVRRTGVRR